MPIVGLSRPEDVDPRFIEIGRLRKGAAKNGNRPGADLSFFRYVPNVRYQESAKVFAELYGKEPTELEVYFPLNEMDRVFSSWREAYTSNRMCKLRCDGARWHDWIEGDRHFHSEAGRECELDYRDTENGCPKCPCRYSGRLSVYLKPMWKAGQIGLVTVITSSINDIAHLASKLVQWEPLTGKPFTLWRAPERIGVPINGERRAKDSNLLHLELADEWMKQSYALAERQASAQLAAPIKRIEPPAEMPPDEPPYDETLAGDDPFLQEGDYSGAPPDETTYADLREEQESDVTFIAPPDTLTEKNLIDLAVKHLPEYENVGTVMTAMLQLYGRTWRESTDDWNAQGAWQQLQEHARSDQ
jgi:hypothetical protein